MKKFSSISKLIEHLKTTKITSQIPMEKNSPDFEWLDNNGEGVIIPCLNKNNDLYLYRGQNERFSPCVSSLLRGEVIYDDIFIYSIKMVEFQALLDSTPLTQLSKDFGLKVNTEALAQHYGLKTMHLDVTHSLDVAAFFACCKLEGDSWEPMRSGSGVFYRLFGIPNHTFEIVGPQIYPRPKEQLAESVPVDIGEDFETKPFVEIFEFEHSYNESLNFLNKFNSGKDLFPPDPLSEKAKLITDEKSLSIDTCKRSFMENRIPEDKWEEKIQEADKKLKESGKGFISERCEHTFSQGEIEITEHPLPFGDVGFRPCFYPDE